MARYYDHTRRDRATGRWARVTGMRGRWHIACGYRGQFEATFFNRHETCTQAGAETLAKNWVARGDVHRYEGDK